MGRPVWPPTGLQGCCIVRCSIVDVNSVWGLDLRQTGRQSLSSQQPTSLSATLAVTKSIMFSLLCHYQHHERGGGGVSFHLLQLLLSWMVSSVWATCQAKRDGLPIWKPWVNPVPFWVRRDSCTWRGEKRWETVIVMPRPASTRRQSIPQCCSYPWPSCYGCSWRIPHDLSRSLLFVVVSCEWTFSYSEDKLLNRKDVTLGTGHVIKQSF